MIHRLHANGARIVTGIDAGLGPWVTHGNLLQLPPRRLPESVASSTSWVVVAQFLPSLLLGPWFGALADQRDRRRLLIFAETALALVALGLRHHRPLGS